MELFVSLNLCSPMTSWIRSRKFRLGVKVVGEENIRGGRSESVFVEDNRECKYWMQNPSFSCFGSCLL